MKFTYDTKPVEKECVAYIDFEGDLIVRDKHDGELVIFTRGGLTGAFHGEFNPPEAIHRFYPGDSITITFE